MPAALLPREQVVSRILTVFRDYGYEGASLARLSEATGLGRSSLYHYFPNGKDDMAAAALASVSAWFDDYVLQPLSGSEPPRERVRQFASGLAEYYQHGSKACLMNLFTIGDAGERFQKVLRERLRAMLRALAKVAEESGIDAEEAKQRAENALIDVQGALVISRALGTRAPFARVMEELPERLLSKRR